MAISFETAVAIGDALVLPAAIAAALPIYWKWWGKMRLSGPLQIAGLVLIVVVSLADAADRLGFLGPSPSQIADRRDVLESKVGEQAARLDALSAQITVLQNRITQNPAQQVGAATTSGAHAPLILNEGKNVTMENVRTIGLGAGIENHGDGLSIKNYQGIQVPEK